MLESIRELNEVARLSGLGEWAVQTAAALSPERRELNLIVFEAFLPLYFDVMPVMMNCGGFESCVDEIAARDPFELRDAIVQSLLMIPADDAEGFQPLEGVTAEALLNDESLFLRLVSHFVESLETDAAVWKRAFVLYNDPPQMQATIVEHLRWMYHEVFAEEWARVRPLLEESVAAFQALDFSNLTAYEAIRAVTTRDLREKMPGKFDQVDTIVFVPTAHIGPYIVAIERETTSYLIFGARQPRGVTSVSSALSRSELLTRMNALADDTRLRILELLTKNEELCAQDIIEMLGLSQSSVSRHLSQLSANGFITERRREVAKCYSLNTDRVVDTLRTLTNFLARQ